VIPLDHLCQVLQRRLLKKKHLLNEINTPLVKGKNQLASAKMLIDLKASEIDGSLNEIAQIIMPYLTEQMITS
jgi:hypothetical protein